ncbi:NAD-dependent SIR2 family protein deacetylase [Pseudonocardia endophytica]|uniref:protein acetyllysine N-acetyltransferase n=1 Tax=Pseudonocardia endophytica TaxID=401976 RepID=A0A4R1HGD3_PSEEN|nr:NAD-dependent protein deacetylase [Pseudonocardia endophytica]TCK21197.1 NAD-dependent SIR2 family protein deacetylase [Pseudonocardia endophytica]
MTDARALLDGRRLVVLTGAGLSTDSGIPDYRGPDSPPRRPMTYAEFVSGEPAQRRYWARSHVGWARMRRAEPNAGHRALAALQCPLITQNVDGLHGEAGHRDVVDLHGRIDEVICLGCRRVGGRDDLQRRLTELNPGFTESVSAEIESAPDGDAALEATDGFRIAACRACGGVLKPHVVFFGENVPRDRVAHCYAMVEELEPDTGALLVVGSSLAVMSGLRFVKHAAKRDVPVVIVNRGSTRGDDLATVRVDTGCSEFLAELAAERSAYPTSPPNEGAVRAL